MTKKEFLNFYQGFKKKYKNYLDIEDVSDGLENLEFINKLSYYNTMFEMASLDYDEEMAMTSLKQFKEDIKDFEKKEKRLQKSIEKSKFLNDNFFIKDGEVIIITKSKYGYYLIYNNSKGLRVFNLTNKANGFHIFGDGKFCSGNTYQSLRDVANKGNIYALVLALVNILTNYDDKAHHLATPDSFVPWQKLDSKKVWSLKEYRNIEKMIEQKLEKGLTSLHKELGLSPEGKEYIETMTEAIEEELFSRVKK